MQSILILLPLPAFVKKRHPETNSQRKGEGSLVLLVSQSIEKRAYEPTNRWYNQPRIVKTHESIVKANPLAKVIFDGSNRVIFLRCTVIVILFQQLFECCLTIFLFYIVASIHVMNLEHLEQNLFPLKFMYRYDLFYYAKIYFAYVFRSKWLEELFLLDVILKF